jgi:hypothetical protein
MKGLEYAVIDNDIVYTPPQQKNAGLYTGDVLFDKKPWGNSYKMAPVEPDAVAYASQFYASHHIPSGNRPGNNTVNSSKYKKYTENTENNYNFSCFDSKQTFHNVQDVSVIPVVQDVPAMSKMTPPLYDTNNMFTLPSLPYFPNTPNTPNTPEIPNQSQRVHQFQHM